MGQQDSTQETSGEMFISGGKTISDGSSGTTRVDAPTAYWPHDVRFILHTGSYLELATAR